MRSILRFNKAKSKALLIILLIVFLAPLTFFAFLNISYQNKIYPNISIAGLNVGGLSANDAFEVLSRQVNVPQEIKIDTETQEQVLNTADINLKYDFATSANSAFNYSRDVDLIPDLSKRIQLIFIPVNLPLIKSYDDGKLNKYISVLAGQFSQDPVFPKIILQKGTVIVLKGSAGTEVDQSLLRSQIVDRLENAKSDSIHIPVNSIDPSITDEEALKIKTYAETFIGKKLQANFEYSTYILNDSDIISLINPKGGFDENLVLQQVNKIASTVDRDPQNPKFNFDNGKVTEFEPAKDGVKVDGDKFKSLIEENLNSLAMSPDKIAQLNIPVDRTPPEVTTDKVNNLGIKELIGRGTSTYFHSIPGRVHNVSLAASRINGTLVKPGDTFSFNETLGDVSQFTGYQQAYIIQDGKTILGDGGGVCQVSTTLFRALLNAGLPVTERAAHAYRVGYYEQDSPPGLDATVFGPSPDLKFTNDTPGYILIEATADPQKYSLVFELYGASDGRTATISRPIVTNVTPALPTVYQDDPTIPVGTLKQTDFAAAGARVSFNYLVTRNGETIFQKTFVSNYKPWAAVYLRGTKT